MPRQDITIETMIDSSVPLTPKLKSIILDISPMALDRHKARRYTS
jgi:hypothetical protein